MTNILDWGIHLVFTRKNQAAIPTVTTFIGLVTYNLNITSAKHCKIKKVCTYTNFFLIRQSRHNRSIHKEVSKQSFQEEFLKNISPRTKRQENANERDQLCEIRSRFINPQAALNTRGNWMYIVNSESATQLVKTETCVLESLSI